VPIRAEPGRVPGTALDSPEASLTSTPLTAKTLSQYRWLVRPVTVTSVAVAAAGSSAPTRRSAESSTSTW
jgi:hypothetical protein